MPSGVVPVAERREGECLHYSTVCGYKEPDVIQSVIQQQYPSHSPGMHSCTLLLDNVVNHRRSNINMPNADSGFSVYRWLLVCTLPVLPVTVCHHQAAVLPLTCTWPHLRCDVGLEEGNIGKNCLCVTILCYNIMMVHKRTSSSYRSVDCIRLCLAWFSSLFSKCLCVFGLHGAI